MAGTVTSSSRKAANMVGHKSRCRTFRRWKTCASQGFWIIDKDFISHKFHQYVNFTTNARFFT